MPDGNEKERIDESKVVVGLNPNDTNPTVFWVSIPIKRFADDVQEGSWLLRGAMDEAKSIALNVIRGIRAKKKATGGIIKPEVVN